MGLRAEIPQSLILLRHLGCNRPSAHTCFCLSCFSLIQLSRDSSIFSYSHHTFQISSTHKHHYFYDPAISNVRHRLFTKTPDISVKAFNTASESISSVTLALLTASHLRHSYISATSASTASFTALPESPFPAAGETAALPSNSGVKADLCLYSLSFKSRMIRCAVFALGSPGALESPSHPRS